ncbi:MAG: hypothetical protein IT167_05730 [Bryobacterales bacterium]|nr:hypothetical protein [Bryobacterales bacterium]
MRTWIRGAWEHFAIFSAVLGVLALTRGPIAPRYLFFHDTVNFALSIREFNPSLHQPQPPGYPLFVALIKLIYACVPSAETALLLAGMIGAALAVYFLWLLGDSMFGPAAGMAAGVLLLFHPLAWFGGLTNPVRLFLAVCQTGTAMMAWKGWTRQRGSREAWPWLLWLAVTLGVLSGFRPVMLLLSSPLFLAVLVRHRAFGLRLLLPILLLLLAAGSWITVLLVSSGGLDAYLRLIRGYSHEQFGGSSLLFGAPERAAWQMAKDAVVWNTFAAVAWIWAVPLAGLPRLRQIFQGRTFFLLLAFVPAFLFTLLVHVADPDQALMTVPLVCLVGGAVMQEAFVAWRKRIPASAAVAAACLAFSAAISTYLFFHPPAGPARAAGYGVIRYVNNHMRATLAAVDELRRIGPVQIISFRPVVSWRNLSYYFATVPIFVVEPDDPSRVWQAGSRWGQSVPKDDGKVILDSTREIVILLPPGDQGLRKRLRTESGFDEKGGLLHAAPRPGAEFRVGDVAFRTAASLAGK